MHDSESPPPSTENSAAPLDAKSSRAALLIVFLVLFIDLLGFGIVLPLLPRYADQFIPDVPSEWTGEVHGIVIGVLMSSFSAMQFLFAPLWGRISDLVGRRPILLIGLVGSVIFYALFGIASDLPDPKKDWLVIGLLLLARVGAGISGATISTASAVIADSTPKEKRSHGMALIGVAFGLGFTFGPLIAWAGSWIFPGKPGIPDGLGGGPGYLAAILSFVALIIAFRKMPETLPPGGEQRKRSLIDLHGLFTTLNTPTVGLLVFTFFLATFAFANFEGTISLLSKEAFQFSDKQNYLIFAYIGFVLMFVQGFIYRKMVKKIDEVRLMRIGIFGMFLGLGNLAAVAAFSANPPNADLHFAWFMIALAISVFGFAFLNPSLNGLISKRSDPHRQGEILGINQSFSALARILGPFLGILVFKIDPSHIAPYAMAAIMLAIVMTLLTKVKQ